MGRGQELSEAEVRVIQELHAAGVASTEIAQRVKRSKASVSRVISGKRGEKAKMRPGRPKQVTERWARQLVRSVTKSNESAGDASARNKPEFSTRTVQRVLHNHPDMKWKKMKQSTQMNTRHERTRLL